MRLDLKAVDLDDLAQAFEDHSFDHSWWLDPRTGEVVLWSDWVAEQGEPDPETRGLRPIDQVASHDAYGDMEDFIDRVRDWRAIGLRSTSCCSAALRGSLGSRPIRSRPFERGGYAERLARERGNARGERVLAL